MSIYLGLGSNLTPRAKTLAAGIDALINSEIEVVRVSPLVESPPVLPHKSASSWYLPYLNCVVEVKTSLAPRDFLEIIKKIEIGFGRDFMHRWSPRPLDVDILLWHNLVIKEDDLQVPHQELTTRPFCLSPLCALDPLVEVQESATALSCLNSVIPIPLTMGILNATPDSFSDGNIWREKEDIHKYLDELWRHHVAYIDIGGESTRPNATKVPPKEEWRRVKWALDIVQEYYIDKRFSPKISIDSRNDKTLSKAINQGADVINDTTGLRNPEIIAIARDTGCDVVAMHSITVPANSDIVYSDEEDVIEKLEHWIDNSASFWLAKGLDLSRIIIDPGVGFGKTALQSVHIMRAIKIYRQKGFRILVGHSRKSFISRFSSHSAKNRDLETLGLSLGLCEMGVDIIRTHKPIEHVRAYRGWSQLRSAMS